MLKALLFGSLGTIVDASPLEPDAWNVAFEEAGLDWRWSREAYGSMPFRTDGERLLREHARVQGVEMPSDEAIARLLARQRAVFDEWLLEGRAPARPGVRRLMDEATAAGVKLGFVTGTGLDAARATLAAAGEGVRLERFDVFTHLDNVEPADTDTSAAPWSRALADLGIDAADAVAIEDTESRVRAAAAAGLACVATPGAFAAREDPSAADAVVDGLGDLDVAAHPIAGADIVEDGLVTLEGLAALLVARRKRSS